MTSIIFAILSYLLLYKYLTLFFVAYIAALLVPLPSNTSLIAAAAFASQGYLNIYTVVLAAFFANFFGDWTGFFLSRRYGKTFLVRLGLHKVITSKEYLQIEGFIQKNPRITIFITRFFGGVGPLVNILAGLSDRIPFKKFFIFGVTGEFVYVVSLTSAGYFLGDYWQNMISSIESVSAGVFIFVCLIIAYKIGVGTMKKVHETSTE